MNDSHGIAIITEWDIFKEFDWNKIYLDMKKPAFIFDGRNILNKQALTKIGYEVRRIEANSMLNNKFLNYLYE